MSRQLPGLTAPTTAGAIPGRPALITSTPAPPTITTDDVPVATAPAPPAAAPATDDVPVPVATPPPPPDDEAEPSRAAGAAEIAALLASPPEWLDGPRDAGLSALAYAAQRGKISHDQRLAWRWECAVRGPPGSPYAGEHYRVVVRLPLGYPAVAPKLSVLSIVHHLDIEVRDPYEGDLEDPFYEELARRAGSS